MRKVLLGAVAACSLFFAANSDAQTIAQPTPTAPPFAVADPGVDAIATITRASTAVVLARSSSRRFERVGVNPGETISVSIQFPPAKVGHVITPEPLDGGTVTGLGNTLVVQSDGTIQFNFRARVGAGTSRISLHDGAEETMFELWVFDLTDPQNNIPTVNGGN